MRRGEEINPNFPFIDAQKHVSRSSIDFVNTLLLTLPQRSRNSLHEVVVLSFFRREDLLAVL
jgi:hypothetical protein